MKMTLDEVRRIAGLAQIELDPREERKLLADLERIISYIDSLSELETGAIDPFGALVPETPALRADEIQTGLSSEDALANAPESDRGHFKVPRVIPG
jgi:aspartyl-tRNA(Asn)/glutamyl-tRNA(Gln) amidotransferase subunit C